MRWQAVQTSHPSGGLPKRDLFGSVTNYDMEKRRRGRPPMDVVVRVHNDLALIAEVILHERRGATTTHAFDLVSGGKPLSAKTVEHAMYRSLPGVRLALEELDDVVLEDLASRYGLAESG